MSVDVTVGDCHATIGNDIFQTAYSMGIIGEKWKRKNGKWKQKTKNEKQKWKMKNKKWKTKNEKR